ncbi:MAG: response regulator [Bacteroidota bacterium]|nr:response regulator [Bacteroidota bacterium]
MTSPQVLIAEDDESLRGILAEMLAERGITVMQAVDGVQASQMLRDNIRVSLLLSDVKMPRMDGYALVEEALMRNSELKVLMMTGYPGDFPPPAVLKAREIRTLAKPFDLDRMCDQVVDMLARP